MEPGHPRVLPGLLSLLEAGRGEADERIRHALEVLVEQTGVDTAFVSRFRDGQRHVTHLAGLPLPPHRKDPVAVHDTICWLVATEAVETLVTDTGRHPVLSRHPMTRRSGTLLSGLGTHAGVPLVVDGDIVGAVCAVAATPRPDLTARDADRLATTGEFIGQVLARSVRGTPDPVVAQDLPDLPDVGYLAELVARSDDLESLTRPLLELLHAATGLESTYLTFVDWAGDRQQIVHSLNTGSLTIPEGLSVPWSDTLCRRALDAGIPYTADVPAVWGDSDAARELGIRTYVSVPVVDQSQAMIGTLCGAAASSVLLHDHDLVTMQLFARVLAEQISRERAAGRERARAEMLARRTRPLRRPDTVDDLTGLYNRNGIREWLTTAIGTLQPGSEQLAIAFIDVDGFTAINDLYGPDTGDDVLRLMAGSLRAAGRPEDLLGRHDRDRFVAAAVLAPSDASFGNWNHRFRAATHLLHRTAYRPTGSLPGGDLLVHAAVGAITVVEAATTPEHALEVAEQAMRRSKVRGHAG
ncbi:sensor domain-containing diguanylate cyclase [Kineosporia sp. J2-2]|uniref:Sensor domain-containing diguanylate cyclase n=1 Tax=Kineosporia corallincola TaxID=2835133 RepID=A0ABS5TN17_9ACTN|nr:diguanylate cyclase [Kineosporia corallincola]MBT0771463.1 sensor domain-containing diguanylate cyclase [Kineosporia corallincola]